MTKKLEAKVALVTGGSRGIGAAIAAALADEGAHVAISYSASPDAAEKVVRQLTAKGGKAKAFKADQANAAEVEKLVQDVAKEFGRLDILVNNAGVFVAKPLAEAALDGASFDRQSDINVKGVIAGIRAAASVMRDGGRIITIGSAIADRTGFPGVADYAATKAAVVGYTKGIARELAPRNITVNVVQPGSIETDMNPPTGDFADMQRAMIPAGRYGKPEEIAAGVVFLASPAASYVNGSVLTIDGGYST